MIEDQLEALGCQRGAQPWEVIFVDDGSSDGTAAVVESHRASLPRLRVVHCDCGNSYAARNVGLRHAAGTQILCCDADDIVPEDWIVEMQRALAQYDIVGGPTRYWWPDREKVDDAVRNTTDLPHLEFLPFAAGGSFGCSRRVIDELGGWDESLPSGGDVDLSWRAQLAGYELGALPGSVVVLYRQRAAPRAALRQMFRQGQGQALAYRRYGPHGMPRRPLRRTVTEWLDVLSRLPGALRSRQLTTWWRRAGVPLGRIVGSVRFRTVYL